ncbi:hypothetical protein AX15_003784 [Amanita polypyramis BW_CC]|nr:hypothetical protein AX15_003784 [Amanita polypyramis BW_CC]
MPSSTKKRSLARPKDVREKKRDIKKVAFVEPPKSNKEFPNGKINEEKDGEDEEGRKRSREYVKEGLGGVSRSEEGEDEEDEEDDDVDQEGMERLMNALGEDALDDFDRAHLIALHGGSDEDERDGEKESDEEGQAGSDDGEGAEIEDEGQSGSGEEESEDGGEDGEAGKVEGEEDGEEKRQTGQKADEDEDEDEDEDDEEGIALDEVESMDEDVVPRQKVEIDNKAALERIRQSIELPPSLPWTETLTMTYPKKIEVDVDDDLNRELAFYKQALHGANTARELASKHNFSFTRPADYFAEMVKSDAHMERIRQRLLDETANIKRGEEKRREREGKKFGKQVQVEKLKEREKSKKEMDERIKALKRKRKDVLDKPEGGEDFDVAVEDAIADRPAKRVKKQGGPKLGRTARDKKFGFGGSKKHAKHNTRASTDNFGPGASKGKKGAKAGKSNRPGKSKRMAARSKR